MATIINIETSGKICSVALSVDGNVEHLCEDGSGMNHSVSLAPFVEECMDMVRRRGMKLEAVAVSIGPGSYTGLRIGLSMAKGLAFGCGVPLIGVSTLKILAVKAMFRNIEWTGEELLIPMIDARRMEVFTAVYDFALNLRMEASPLIIDKGSYADFFRENRKLIFIGDGVDKAKDILASENSVFLDGLNPIANDMVALSEKALREGDFIDVAYSVPEYLKEYQTTVPKNKVLG